MDSKLRRLERAGDWPAYWAAVRRADLFHRYGETLGPVSLLDAVCAICGITGISYSDCSYCESCHDGTCYFNETTPMATLVKPTGYWRGGGGKIEPNNTVSCNLYRVVDED